VANRDAVGWFAPFITHDLIYDTNAPTLTGRNTTLNLNTKKHELHDRDQLRASMDNVRTQRKSWHPNAPAAATYCFDDTILKPRKGYRAGDPILVVSVDKRVMKDHGDIANPVLINFLGEYILFCQNETTESLK